MSELTLSIPAGWKLSSLQELVAIDTEKLSEGTDGAFSFYYIDISAVSEANLQLPALKITFREAPSRARKVVRPGDVLMATVRPNLKAFAYFGQQSHDFIASTGFAVLTAKHDVDSRFVLYSVLSDSVTAQIESHVVGSNYPAINSKDVRRLQILTPPPSEQRKIALILTTLDNQIEKTEALIAKYQAIKQGMMHDLFTRGVDEDGQLRPSHADAPGLYKQSELGWIPKEWDETTVGNELLGIDAGKSPDCPDMPAPSGEWGVLKVSAVQPDGFLSSENKIILNPIYINPLYVVQDGDLLISRSNTYQLVGLVCLVRSPQPRLMLCDKTLRLRFNPCRATVDFMFWMLQQPLARRHIEVHATGTSGSMKNISQPVIRSLRIGLPPISEQKRINCRLWAVRERITTEQRTVEKLRYKKLGIMQDLLTGQVRVKIETSKKAEAHA